MAFVWRRSGGATRLARLTPSGVEESDEIYLLPAPGQVKIRDALMDIKVLGKSTPTGSSSGPGDEGRLSDLRPPRRRRCSRRSGCRFRRHCARATPGRVPWAVCRAGCDYPRGEGPQTAQPLQGRCCMAELSEVVARKAHPTFAVESEDATGVMRAVREWAWAATRTRVTPRPRGADR